MIANVGVNLSISYNTICFLLYVIYIRNHLVSWYSNFQKLAKTIKLM